MDFQQLLARMQELDRPAVETTTVTDEGGCGMDAPMAPPLSAVPPKPDTPPPSMSVNLNAQGLDNIEDMMKLFQKVNPDMGPKDPMPSLEPSIMSIKPSLPPLKMLPDFDADNDEMPGGEKDSMMKMDLDKDDHEEPDGDEMSIKGLDRDNDGDHDMDDHDMEKKKEKDEAYANEPNGQIKTSSLISGNDLHKEKGTYPKVAGGDNPMQKQKNESGDLRAQIRAELLRRLEEAKGAK